MIYNASAIRRMGKKHGDVMYAFAYTPQNGKQVMMLKQKPIMGILSACNAEPGPYCKPDDTDIVRYFVPYAKNAATPVWSRSVNLDSREYADTLEEAQAGYNRLVQNMEAWHLIRAAVTAGDGIPGNNPNLMKIPAGVTPIPMGNIPADNQTCYISPVPSYVFTIPAIVTNGTLFFVLSLSMGSIPMEIPVSELRAILTPTRAQAAMLYASI